MQQLSRNIYNFSHLKMILFIYQIASSLRLPLFGGELYTIVSLL